MALVWEVSNTFGERHSYVIGVDDPDAATIRQHAKKLLHVSPFIGMDIDYVFRVTRGDDALTVGIDEDLLDQYNRLFASKGGNAVVALEHEVCTGCHMKLTTQTLVRVRGAQEITHCEQCGRILYWTV